MTFAKPMNGRHVLLMLVAFFGITFLVNGFLVYYAQSSFTGLTDEHAYEHGLAYNNVIAQGTAQDREGWRAHAQYGEGHFLISLSEKDGAVEGATGKVTLYRVSNEGEDRNAPLQPIPGQSGHYTAAIDPPESGLWEVRIEAQYNGKTYISHQRMDIR